MKAIGYKSPGPLDGAGQLLDVDAPEPQPGPQDLVVEVRAVSVNPVDTKVRRNMDPAGVTRVLGFDAAGVVCRVGEQVTLFKEGDEVYYAGDLTRPGTNAQRQAVDQRIVGAKPSSLTFAEAAALPLTAITAWELLFDSLALVPDQNQGEGDTLLIIGGAGGVGSILIQLAKTLTGLTVIATASRPETTRWVKEMGADHVIDHRQSLVDQCAALDLSPRFVASLTASDQHFDAVVELLQPRGHLALIDDPGPLDIASMKRKALSLSWEFMFTRSMFQTPDMTVQHELLNTVSGLVDGGALRTTATSNLGLMTVDTLTQAHRMQESGTVIGKTVLEGFTTGS